MRKKGVTIWLVFMTILSNKIMHNYQKRYPQKRGKGNLPWLCGNRERLIPIYAEKVVLLVGDVAAGRGPEDIRYGEYFP